MKSQFNASPPSYDELKDLGQVFLGPIFLAYFTKLKSQSFMEKEGGSLFFFGREGYHLKRIFDALADEGLVGRKDAKYLSVSRAFLFKLTLSDARLLPLSLKHRFEGTFGDLVSKRFLLDPEKLDLPGSLRRLPVSLPRDAVHVRKLLEARMTPTILVELEGEKRIYGEYLRSLGFGASPENPCIDIGFSGTIQILLTELFAVETQGYYFYSSKDLIHVDAENGSGASAQITGLITSGRGFGEGSGLVDNSLILESLLTAPTGQFKGIAKGPAGFEFRYAEKTDVQKYFHFTYPIINGVVGYLSTCMRVCEGAKVDDLVDLEELYMAILKWDKGREMEFLRSFLEIDDQISGFGIIKPAKFLPDLVNV